MPRVRPAAVLLSMLPLAMVVRAGVVLNRTIDPDESQHLHVAWRVAQGQVPYRDFWEHHLPLFHYLAAPLTAWLPDRPEVYFAARALMVVAAAAVVFLTWRIAGRLSPAGAAWAAVVLVWLPQFVETSTETRPDVPALVAHVASLAALVRWRAGEGAGWLWAAGAGQGVACALSLKAVYGLLGVALAAAGPVLPGAGAGRARRIPALLRLAGGAALGPGVVVAWLAWRGGAPAVRGLGRHVVGGSLGFVDWGKTWPMYGSEVSAFVVAALGLALVLRARGRGVLAHPVHGALVIPTLAVTVMLALPWTPAVYQHAWLPVLPVVAIYAGLAIGTLWEFARRRPAPGRIALVAAAVAAAVVVPAGESITFAVRDQNASQILVMRRALELACPGEPVLDGTALVVFRPAAHRYGALVTGVREWVARGVVAEETLEADMRAAGARVALPDKRLRAMVGPVAEFLRRHYVPHRDGLLVAGAQVPAAAGGGRAYVDLLVDGWHLLTVPPLTAVSVDGREVRAGWLALSAGRHEVTWQGGGGTVRLAAATCPERRSLPAAGGPA